MREFIKRWNLDRADVLALTFVLILTILSIFSTLNSPVYNYIICQGDRCIRVESYTKTSNGLEYLYDDKKGIVQGDYIIKEK
jgi:hypothetical protein